MAAPPVAPVIPSFDPVSLLVNAALQVSFRRIAKRMRHRSPVVLPDPVPSYDWSGAVMTSNSDIPVALAYGRVKIKGNYINFYTNSDGDKAFLYALIGISEGPIEQIERVLINGKDASLYEGVAVEQRLGTNTQPPITSFEAGASDFDAGDLALNVGETFTYAGVKSNASQVSVNVFFPDGLYVDWRRYERFDQVFGRRSEWVYYQSGGSVTIRVEFKRSADASFVLFKDFVVAHSTRTRFSRRLVLDESDLAPLGTPDRFDLRITKLSEDFPVDGEEVTRHGATVWDSVTETDFDDIAYVNTAHVGLKAIGQEQLSGRLPDVEFVIKGKKTHKYVPLGGGLFDKVEAAYPESANPAWCLIDALLDARYGLGALIREEDLDLQSFADFANICGSDEAPAPSAGFVDLGNGLERRHRMDIVFDVQGVIRDMLEHVLTNYNAFIAYDQGKFKVRRVRQEAGPFRKIAEDKVREGTFQVHFSDQESSRLNVVRAQFTNEEQDFSRDIVQVMEDEFGEAEPKRDYDVNLLGVTRFTEAQRQALFLLKISRTTQLTCVFKTTFEFLDVEVGDVVEITHSLGGFVDQPFLVVQAVYDNAEEITFYCEEYNPAVYEDDNAALGLVKAAPLSTNLPNPQGPPPSVENLDARELPVFRLDGSYESKIEVSWEDPTSAQNRFRGWPFSYKEAKVFFSDDGGQSFAFAGVGRTQYVIDKGIREGQVYTVAVVAVSADGSEQKLADAARKTVLVKGKDVRPATVTGFSATLSDERLRFVWNPVGDRDLKGYLIREGQNWFESRPVNLEPVRGTTFEYENVCAGARQFLIKAVDRTGNQSITEDSFLIVISPDDLPARREVVEIDLLDGDDPAAPDSFTAVDGSLVGAGGVTLQGVGWSGLAPVSPIVANRFYLLGKAVPVIGEVPTVNSGFITTGEIDLGRADDYIVCDEISTGQLAGENTVDDVDQDFIADHLNETVDEFTGRAGLAGLEIEIAVSDVSPAAAFQTYRAGDSYSGRFFAFRVKMINVTDDSVPLPENNNVPFIDAMKFHFETARRVERFNALAVASGGQTVAFARAFWTIPTVEATAQQSAGGEARIVNVQNATLADFNIRVTRDNGQDVAGAATVYAEGF